MSAKRDVQAAQAESETSKDGPLPERMRGQRRSRSVVQSVRLPEAGTFGSGTSDNLPADASRQQRLLDALGRRP